jgi:hypothetical protein
MAESSGAPAGRPRPALLAGLALALAGLVVYLLGPAARPAAPSNPAREQRRPVAPPAEAAAHNGGPASLDVRLDALKQPPPAPEAAARNPFRFYVKPPPPPPPPPRAPRPGDKDYKPAPPPPPPVPTVPPIPLKFIGTLETKGRKVAIFVNIDGRGLPVYASEGETVLGQYRVVKIGVESVTMEYLDGRGQQTIPLRG